MLSGRIINSGTVTTCSACYAGRAAGPRAERDGGLCQTPKQCSVVGVLVSCGPTIRSTRGSVLC
jgi:hypothetical protein